MDWIFDPDFWMRIVFGPAAIVAGIGVVIFGIGVLFGKI